MLSHAICVPIDVPSKEAFGFKAGALLTGVIWTLWHLPLVFFADYSNATPWWFGVSCFAALMLSMSVIMAWLRLTSGSLWTAALFHASHNQFIQVFFTPLTSSRGAITSYAVDEFGFALPVTVLLVAVLFWTCTLDLRVGGSGGNLQASN